MSPWGMSLFLSLSCMLTWTVYVSVGYVTVLIIVMYVDMDCLCVRGVCHCSYHCHMCLPGLFMCPWGMSLFLSLSCVLTWTVYVSVGYVTVLIIVMYVDMDCLCVRGVCHCSYHCHMC